MSTDVPVVAVSAQRRRTRWSSEREALAASLGDIFEADLLTAVTADPDAQCRTSVLQFLRFLSEAEAGTVAHKVQTAFVEGPEAVFAQPTAHERAFLDVFKLWCEHYISNAGVKPTTVVNRCRLAAAKLESLSGQQPGIPRAFKANMIRLAQPLSGSSPSLGQAQWPELEGLSGIEREREALKIVRAECCRAFVEEEAAFRRARAVLIGEVPDGADPEACARVRPLLLQLETVLMATGNLYAMHLLHHPEIRGDNPALDPRHWRAAGFAIGPHTSVLRGPSLVPFVPTRRMVASCVGVLICDTGWNVQPMLDLSSAPFVFRSSRQAFIATPAFIESFKKRAGHHVLAYLGEQAMLTDRRLEEARAVWQETIENEGDPADPRYAAIDLEPGGEPNPALNIMERYRAVVETSIAAIAGLPAAADLKRHFWILSGETGLMKPRQVGFEQTEISRRGATYRAIRKTVQLIRFDESGSVRAVSRSAGHVRTSVIMPHYLNAPHIAAQLDRSIREFQNAVQGVVTRDLDQRTVATLLNVTEENLRRMWIHAERAGVAAALGLVRDSEEGISSYPVIRFAPDQHNLFELYLAHRSLQQLRMRTRNHARYRLRYLPMLALAKAIGREVFRKGHGPRYVKAARSAASALRDGSVSLPFLGE
jgi:hypothetical protein